MSRAIVVAALCAAWANIVLSWSWPSATGLYFVVLTAGLLVESLVSRRKRASHSGDSRS
ncbi:MAG TPA: hypothetical protein PKA99_01775 [Dermatophilaceae bacterium]|jgi:hypothetical protein|nr:hypothetical protein [Dermatophilaceae bacterium]